MTRAKASTPLRTSDVARPRLLGLTALGGALGAVIAMLGEGRPLAQSKPIARAHQKVECASCHSESKTTEGDAPPHHMAAGCVTCHGGHASTRPAHRNLAAKGELSCGTCHSQHRAAQGITFDDHAIVRWGAGSVVPVEPSKKLPGALGVPAGTTVPLVSLAACAKCHEPTRAADAIAACVPADVRTGTTSSLAALASGCFDEHVRLGDLGGDSRRSHDACAHQHTPTRFVAWDAARAIANTTEWVAPASKEGAPWGPTAGGLAGAFLAMAGVVALDRRKGRPAAQRDSIAPPPRKRLPVIDPSTCLGCYACVDACPFDVLAIEKYVAVVARPEECCGVVLCEQVCPNGSLRVADGPAVLDRPATDANLESVDVPGVYLAGDLTGLPLIKNAIQQGVHVIDRIADTPSSRRTGVVDVVVIGAGPAGISAALRAKEKGLSCVVVEQATIAASIKSFPRDKIVHDPPLDLPVEGELWLKESTKEELLAQWSRIVRARRLDVREGHRVVDIVRADEGFSVVADAGGTRVEMRAARVVVAIGRRGTPRKLELEWEPGTEERVAYALADARSFEGKRVLVVGLGDAAMEAAIALARQPRTEVTISYRGSRFVRGKKKNVTEIESLIRDRKLEILFETLPVAITKTGVTLAGTGAHETRRTVNADAMLVLIGGTPAWDLLTRVGLKRPG